jgi:hypothetical protein
LLGFAEVVFTDRRRGLEHRRPYYLLAEAPPSGQPAGWHAAETIADGLAAAPEENARWTDVPEPLNTAKKLKTLERAFTDFLYSNAKLAVLTNRTLNLVGQPGEDVLAFQQRCRAAAHQQAEQALAEEKPRYSARFEAMNAPLPDAAPARQAEVEKTGSSWLSWVPFLTHALDPKTLPQQPRRSPQQQAKLAKLEKEWRARLATIYEKWKRLGESYEELLLKPRKADVRVTHFGLAWVPFWRVSGSGGGMETVPAYQPAAARGSHEQGRVAADAGSE